MNILWVTFAPITRQDGILTSEIASVRYRILIPSKFLDTLNYYKQTFIMKPHLLRVDEMMSIVEKQDIIIFSKTIDPKSQQLAKQAKALGIKIIFDICDDYFQHSDYSQSFKKMISLADVVTANTLAMAQIVKQHTQKQAVVIHDPYEGQRAKPHFQPHSDYLRLLWFGNKVNVSSLEKVMPDLMLLSQKQPITLDIISQPYEYIDYICNQYQNKFFQLKFSKWSLETTQKAMQQSDIIIIPSIISDHRNIVKSPNRLIESLWAGRFVVAHPIPSYQEFSRWIWVNENLTNGILWALQHQPQVTNNIAVAQQYIAQHYSPKLIGSLWDKLLSSFAQR